MVPANFLGRLRTNRIYLYISIILIGLFFAGSALIIPKITLVSENLLEDVIQENLKSKKKSVAFELNQLDNFFGYSQTIIKDAPEVPFEELREKLLFTTNLATTSDLISNSFVYLATDQGIKKIDVFSKGEQAFDRTGLNYVSKLVTGPTDDTIIDTIIDSGQRVINRRMYLQKGNADTTVVVGYDIDLNSFWKYFSEKYEAGSGYTVITNDDGICLLHPEEKYIGTRLGGYFQNISIAEVLDHNDKIDNSNRRDAGKILKDTATSEFLDLEVVRYFDEINVEETSLIVIESFPVEIVMEETTQEVQRYFTWISLMAFLTFLLLLLVSRFQLRKEYLENLKVVEEKEQLAIANEKYQKENAILQLNQLKKKMNPHFLFNSLNSLHILIASKPEVSQEFVLKLAEVYRYFLEDKEGNLITVKKEMEFLEQYIFLHEIRFKNSFHVSIENAHNDEWILYRKIPFLALETLVENAIKHNEFTKDNPLRVAIKVYEDHIIVENNYTPKQQRDQTSHKLGLSYLKNTYEHHGVSSFKTEIVDGTFRCFLPLLS